MAREPERPVCPWLSWVSELSTAYPRGPQAEPRSQVHHSFARAEAWQVSLAGAVVRTPVAVEAV
jgi:hypothetical protein